MLKLLITGSSGYIGSRFLSTTTIKSSLITEVSLRAKSSNKNFEIHELEMPNHPASLGLKKSMLHLASETPHLLKTKQSFDLNLRLTEEALSIALQSGVDRFILMSSIGVLGSQTTEGKFFLNTSPYNPHNSYTLSKMRCEQIVKRWADLHMKEYFIIRPPLVYGLDSKRGMTTIKKMIEYRFPIPTSKEQTKRSYIHVKNLIEVIDKTIYYAGSARNTINVSDGNDLSYSEIVSLLSDNLKINPIRFNIDKPLIKSLLIQLGFNQIYKVLSNELRIDISETQTLLDWYPRYNFRDILDRV